MSIGLRITTCLALLVALSGYAGAQNAPCPECDEDGEANPDSTYHSIDIGLIDEDDAEILVDSDLATSHSDDEKGFWTWLSLCLGAWIAAIGDTLGVDADVDANVEAYVSQDGVDLDASLLGQSFDESPLGDLDGQTWEAMGEANAQLESAGVDPRVGFPGEAGPGQDIDACLYGTLDVATCG